MINWKLQPTACGGGALRIFDMCTGSGITILFADVDKLTRMLDDIAEAAESCVSGPAGEVPEAVSREFPERL